MDSDGNRTVAPLEVSDFSRAHAADSAGEAMALVEPENIRQGDSPSAISRPEVVSVPSLPRCPIVLRGEGERAVAIGNWYLDPPLKGVTYKVIKALIAAYPDRLSGKQLDKKAKGTDTRAHLRDLCKAFPLWRAFIDFPSGKNGYAIKPLTAPPPGFPASPGKSPVELPIPGD
jgi:hypothetical protein